MIKAVIFKAGGLQIALASSAKEEELERHKESMRVEDLLEAAASADDAERSKPHPDIFQAALAGLKGVAPAEAVVVGVTLWLVYGFIKGEAAIIVTNAVTLVLGAAIVWMKLKFK